MLGCCEYIKIKESKSICAVVDVNPNKQLYTATMKAVLVLVGVVLLLVEAAYSVPLDEFEDLEYGGNEGIRQRRVTCDLLSPEISIKGVGGKVNHGACAANCLSMGKAGGRCNDGVCQCRKTTFKDLWNKRFG